jgi:uncharacterized protein (TIGR00369 family)
MAGFDPTAFIAEYGGASHNGLVGSRYVAHGEDWVELAIPYDPRLVADEASGVLASGPIVALMDMAASMAIWVRKGAFAPHATLDLRVDYLRPAIPGRTVIGRGECYRLTRHVSFVRGQAHDGDPADPVAHVAGTYMNLDPARRA